MIPRPTAGIDPSSFAPAAPLGSAAAHIDSKIKEFNINYFNINYYLHHRTEQNITTEQSRNQHLKTWQIE